MKISRRYLSILGVFVLSTLGASPARAATLRVPGMFATIQDAVNAAAPGDQIRVGQGQWCGAEITKQLDLVGEDGATIVGCPAPSLFGVLRIGLLFPTVAGSPASGSSVRHFTFDGRGITNAELSPLAFAVFARDVDNLAVEQNTVLGTIQAITNTRGSGWSVSHNTIRGLTVLTCDGFCGGGDGIVFQQRTSTAPRAIGNAARFNVVTGAIPDTLNEFSMTGIFLIGQDSAVLTNNRIGIPDNPAALGDGLAIEVADSCCGLGVSILTTVNSTIVDNDGRDSEFAVVIDLDANGGTGNSVGTILRGNFGVNDINGSTSNVRNRSKKTLVTFP